MTVKQMNIHKFIHLHFSFIFFILHNKQCLDQAIFSYCLIQSKSTLRAITSCFPYHSHMACLLCLKEMEVIHVYSVYLLHNSVSIGPFPAFPSCFTHKACLLCLSVRNWYFDEPSCGGEACVVMYHQPTAHHGLGGAYLYQWNDDRCNMKHNFICKYEPGKRKHEAM